MTDRTNLDVAAAAHWHTNSRFAWKVGRQQARAALDAIHPALADLTPDDVAAIFTLALAARRSLALPVSFTKALAMMPDHAWEVLSRD